MSNLFDPTTLFENAENAPEAGFVPVNYGKLTTEAFVVTWSDADGERKPTRTPLAKGQKVGPNETLELKFSVDLSELNPALQFAYERNVNVKQSSSRAKTDWTEIVLPSLIAVFGEKWAVEIAKQPYVCIEDVDNVNGTLAKKSQKMLTVPKFIAKYPNKAACAKAREDRFGGSGSGAATIPTTVIGQVKGLLTSMKDEGQVLAVLATKPFGDYEAQELLDAAKAAA